MTLPAAGTGSQRDSGVLFILFGLTVTALASGGEANLAGMGLTWLRIMVLALPLFKSQVLFRASGQGVRRWGLFERPGAISVTP